MAFLLAFTHILASLGQVVRDPDTQRLLDMISYALGPASGLVVYKVVQWVLGQFTESGHPLAPFWARWLTWLITALVPTALYLLYVGLSGDPFNIATWILDVLAAFGISQMIHGQVSLSRVPVKQVPLTKLEIREMAKDKRK